MSDFKVKLWEAINAYAEACGGDTSSETISDDRADCVSLVERIIYYEHKPLTTRLAEVTRERDEAMAVVEAAKIFVEYWMADGDSDPERSDAEYRERVVALIWELSDALAKLEVDGE